MNQRQLMRVIKSQIRSNSDHYKELLTLRFELNTLKGFITEEGQRRFFDLQDKINDLIEDYDYNILDDLFSSLLKMFSKDNVFDKVKDIVRSLFR